MNKKPKQIIIVAEDEIIDNNLQKAESFQTDRRFTGRNKQLNLKVTAEFIHDIKEMSFRENLKMVEVMEKLLSFYKENKKK